MESSGTTQGNPHVRRLVTCLAAALTACMVVIGGAAAANAVVVVGGCKVNIGDPHASSHVSGTINAVSSIQCSLNMPSIHIQAFLYKAPSKYWTGNADSRVSPGAGKKLQSNRAVSCKEGPGSFRNRTYLQFTSPSGVNPAYHSKTYYSPWRSIACGVAFSAPTQDQGLTVDTSVLSDGSIEFGDPYVDTSR